MKVQEKIHSSVYTGGKCGKMFSVIHKEVLTMKALLPFFPLSAGSDTPMGLAISIICYIVASIIFGVLFWFLKHIPIVNLLVGIASTIVGVYCFIGIVLAILIFLKKLVK